MRSGMRGRPMPRRMGRPGLLGTVARTAVVAGPATAVVGGVHRHQEQKTADQQPADTQQPSPPAGQDRLAKIKELGQMRDQGLLTDQEFASEKARLLATSSKARPPAPHEPAANCWFCLACQNVPVPPPPDPGSSRPASSADRTGSDRLAWLEEGAHQVVPGIYRIPLPLPFDGLRAVNAYAIESAGGLTMIDSGWMLETTKDQLERSLARIGAGFGDIRSFLVTHIHP